MAHQAAGPFCRVCREQKSSEADFSSSEIYIFGFETSSSKFTLLLFFLGFSLLCDKNCFYNNVLSLALNTFLVVFNNNYICTVCLLLLMYINVWQCYEVTLIVNYSK
jgi:hypothetical protein